MRTSRYRHPPELLHVRGRSGPIALATFRETVTRHGIPASTLTHNGVVYTTRFARGRGGRNGLDA